MLMIRFFFLTVTMRLISLKHLSLKQLNTVFNQQLIVVFLLDWFIFICVCVFVLFCCLFVCFGFGFFLLLNKLILTDRPRLLWTSCVLVTQYSIDTECVCDVITGHPVVHLLLVSLGH